ncbi:hypothetical protein [Candidatus Lokiarchaeum ossiferum]
MFYQRGSFHWIVKFDILLSEKERTDLIAQGVEEFGELSMSYWIEA